MQKVESRGVGAPPLVRKPRYLAGLRQITFFWGGPTRGGVGAPPLVRKPANSGPLRKMGCFGGWVRNFFWTPEAPKPSLQSLEKGGVGGLGGVRKPANSGPLRKMGLFWGVRKS